MQTIYVCTSAQGPFQLLGGVVRIIKCFSVTEVYIYFYIISEKLSQQGKLLFPKYALLKMT